ncbi:hypothetical protein [Cohaesibacter celericrescens]|uniref:DUF2946 domain-containing protein n=1 Tax=Cohaesibacter celericrescens TaxID=2067669 RepID=A0A2N5XTJ7_9HYPH|nr:hypothetical protein [Cohaesibacter celericrescens]PLW77819.1 hypothetical protein C0081_07445 [Cohaesibacter celericrescens]
MRRLAKDYLALWVALLALTSQLFFGVVHSTSLWVAASGSAVQVEKGSVAFSFLQICSAGGLVTLEGNGPAPDKDGKGRCPVCASAVTAAMMDVVIADIVAVPQFAKLHFLARVDQFAAIARTQTLYIRGPPAFSQLS